MNTTPLNISTDISPSESSHMPPRSTMNQQQSQIPPSIQMLCHDISQFYVTYRQACIISLQYYNNTLPPQAPLPQVKQLVEKCNQDSKQFILFAETLFKVLLKLSTHSRAMSFDIVFGLISRILMERDILPTYQLANDTIITLLLQSIALVFESVLLLPVFALKKLQLAQLQSFSSLLFFFISFFKPIMKPSSTTTTTATATTTPTSTSPQDLVPNTDYPNETIIALFRSIQCLLLIASKIDNTLIIMALMSQPLLPLIQLVASIATIIVPEQHYCPELQHEALYLCDIIRSTYSSDTVYVEFNDTSLPNTQNTSSQQEPILYWSLIFSYQRAIYDAEAALRTTLSTGVSLDGKNNIYLDTADFSKTTNNNNNDNTTSSNSLIQQWQSLPSVYLHSQTLPNIHSIFLNTTQQNSNPSHIHNKNNNNNNNNNNNTNNNLYTPAQFLNILTQEYKTLLLYPRTHHTTLTELIYSPQVNTIFGQNNTNNNNNAPPTGIKLRSMSQKRDRLLLGTEALCGLLPGLLSLCFNMLTTNSSVEKIEKDSKLFSQNNPNSKKSTQNPKQDQFTTIALLQLWTNIITSCCSDNILRLLLICPRHLEHCKSVQRCKNEHQDVSNLETPLLTTHKQATISSPPDSTQNDKDGITGDNKNNGIHPTLQILFNNIPAISHFLTTTPQDNQNIQSCANTPAITHIADVNDHNNGVGTLIDPLKMVQNNPIIDPLTPEWLQTTITHPPFKLLYPLDTNTNTNTTIPTPTNITSTNSTQSLTSLSNIQLDSLFSDNDNEKIQSLQYTGMRTKQWLFSTQKRISDLISCLYNPLTSPSHLMNSPYTLTIVLLSAFTLLYHCPIFLFEQRIVLLDVLVAGVYHHNNNNNSINLINNDTNPSLSGTKPIPSQPITTSLLAKHIIHLIFSQSTPDNGPNIPSPLLPGSKTQFFINDIFFKHFSHIQFLSPLSLSLLVGSRCYCELLSSGGGNNTNGQQNGWTISSLLFEIGNNNTTTEDNFNLSPNIKFDTKSRANLFELTINRIISLPRQLRSISSGNYFGSLDNNDAQRNGEANLFSSYGDFIMKTGLHSHNANQFSIAQQYFATQLVLGYLELIPALTSIVNYYHKLQLFTENRQNMTNNPSQSSPLHNTAPTSPPPTTFADLTISKLSPIVASLCHLLRLQVESNYSPENTTNSSLNAISIYPTPLSPLHPPTTLHHSAIKPFHSDYPIELLRQIPQRLVWAMGGNGSILMIQTLSRSIQISLSHYCFSFVTWGLSLSHPLAQSGVVSGNDTTHHHGQQGLEHKYDQFDNQDLDEKDNYEDKDYYDNDSDLSFHNDENSTFMRTSRLLGMNESTFSSLTRLKMSNSIVDLNDRNNVLLGIDGTNGSDDVDNYHSSIKIGKIFGTMTTTAQNFKKQTLTRVITEVSDSAYDDGTNGFDFLFSNQNSQNQQGGGHHNDHNSRKHYGSNTTYILERIYVLYLFFIGIKGLIHYYLDVKTKRINPFLNGNINWTTPSAPPSLATLQTTIETIINSFFIPMQRDVGLDFDHLGDETAPITLFTLPNQPHHLVTTSLSIIHNIASLSTNQDSFNPTLSPQGVGYLAMNYLYTTHLQSMVSRLLPLLFSISKPNRRQHLLTSTPLLTQLLTKVALGAGGGGLGSNNNAAALTGIANRKQHSDSVFLLTVDINRALFDLSVLLYPPSVQYINMVIGNANLGQKNDKKVPNLPNFDTVQNESTDTNVDPNDDRNDDDDDDNSQPDITGEVISTLISNNLEVLVNNITLQLHRALQIYNLEAHLNNSQTPFYTQKMDSLSHNDASNTQTRFLGTLHDVISAMINLRGAFQTMLQVFLSSQNAEILQSYTLEELQHINHSALLHWRNSIKRAESILRHHEVMLEDRLGIPLLLSFILTATTYNQNQNTTTQLSPNGNIIAQSPTQRRVVNFTLLRDVLNPTFELLSMLTQKHQELQLGSFIQTDASFIPSFESYHNTEQEFISNQYRNHYWRYGELAVPFVKTSFDENREYQILSFLSTKQTYHYLVSMTLCYLDVIHTIIATMLNNTQNVFENARYDFWFEYLKRHIGRTIRTEVHTDLYLASKQTIKPHFSSGFVNNNVDDQTKTVTKCQKCQKHKKGYAQSNNKSPTSTKLIDANQRRYQVLDPHLTQRNNTANTNSYFIIPTKEQQNNSVYIPLTSNNPTSISNRHITQDTLQLLVTTRDNESYMAGGQNNILQLFSDHNSNLYVSTAPNSSQEQLHRLKSRIAEKLIEKEQSKQQYRRYYVHQRTQLNNTSQDLSSIWLSLQQKERKHASKTFEENTQYDPDDPLGENNPILNGEDGLGIGENGQDDKFDFADSDFDEEITIGRSTQRKEHAMLSASIVQGHKERQKDMLMWMKQKIQTRIGKTEQIEYSGNDENAQTNQFHPDQTHGDDIDEICSTNGVCDSQPITVDNDGCTCDDHDHGDRIDNEIHHQLHNDQTTTNETPKDNIADNSDIESDEEIPPPPFDPYLDDPLWLSPPRFNNYVDDDENPRPITIEESQVEKLLFFITPFLSLSSLEPIIINRVLNIINKCVLTMNYIGKLPHLYLSGQFSTFSAGTTANNSGTSANNITNGQRMVQSQREVLRGEYKQQMRAAAMHSGKYKPKKKNMFAGMVRSREGWDIDIDGDDMSNLPNSMKGDNNESNSNFGQDDILSSVQLESLLMKLRTQLCSSNLGVNNADPQDHSNIHENTAQIDELDVLFGNNTGVSEVAFIDSLLYYILQENNLTFLLPGGGNNDNLTTKRPQHNNRSSLPPLISSLLPSILPTFPIHTRWDSRLLPLLTSLWPSVKLLLYPSKRSTTSVPTPIPSSITSSLGTMAFLPSTLKVVATICTLSHGFFSQRFVSEIYPYIVTLLTSNRLELINIIHNHGHGNDIYNLMNRPGGADIMTLYTHQFKAITSILNLLKVIIIAAPTITHSLLSTLPPSDDAIQTAHIAKLSFIELMLSLLSPLLPSSIQALALEIISILALYEREVVMSTVMNVLSKIGIDVGDVVMTLGYAEQIQQSKKQNQFEPPNSNPDIDSAPENPSIDSSTDRIQHYHPLHLSLPSLHRKMLPYQQRMFHNDDSLDKFTRREVIMGYWDVVLSLDKYNNHPDIGLTNDVQNDYKKNSLLGLFQPPAFDSSSSTKNVISTTLIETFKSTAVVNTTPLPIANIIDHNHEQMNTFLAQQFRPIINPNLPQDLQVTTINTLIGVVKLLGMKNGLIGQK